MSTPCPHCGKPIRPGAGFCGHCGKSLAGTPQQAGAPGRAASPGTPPASSSAAPVTSPPPASPANGQKFCPHCGKPVKANAKFCAACGQSIPADPTPVTPPLASPPQAGGQPAPQPAQPPAALPPKKTGLRGWWQARSRIMRILLILALFLVCLCPVAGMALFYPRLFPKATSTPTLASPTETASPEPTQTLIPTETASPTEIPIIQPTPSETPGQMIEVTAVIPTLESTLTATPTFTEAPTLPPAPTETPTQTPAPATFLNETFDTLDDWTTWGEATPTLTPDTAGNFMLQLLGDATNISGITSKTQVLIQPGSTISFKVNPELEGGVFFNWDPGIDIRIPKAPAGPLHLAVFPDNVTLKIGGVASCEIPLEGNEMRTYQLIIQADYKVVLYINELAQEQCSFLPVLVLSNPDGLISFSGTGYVDDVIVTQP